MMTTNIYAAWVGILLGCLAGAVKGLFFRDENWLGGYVSWTRRMLRLAHVSFFGIAFINMSFALSASALGINAALGAPSVLFIIGAISMPLVCYLSAVKDTFRHLFFIPVLSIILGTVIFLWRVL